jgi:ketosteroid isomerase-like protein
MTEATERPIEVIRRVNNTWAVRPFEVVRTALMGARDWDHAVRRFEEAGLPVDPIDPDVEVIVEAFPAPNGLIGQTGRDGWIRFWQSWVEPWEDFTMEESHYEQIGDHVLAEVVVCATPRGGGDEVEIAAVQLFKVRNGEICLYGVYPNRDDALAAIRAE